MDPKDNDRSRVCESFVEPHIKERNNMDSRKTTHYEVKS